MAAYTDIIAIVGGAASNSYVTGAEADSYAEFQSWNDAWLGKTESERTIALINACNGGWTLLILRARDAAHQRLIQAFRKRCLGRVLMFPVTG